jgi:beta-lactamase regulating signal transducer with metallopeptidase domain
MSDALLTLGAANLAAAVAVALVLILRRPARKLFGPRIAYGLWLLVPLAAMGMLLPARVETVTVRAASAPTTHASPLAAQGVSPNPSDAPFDGWLLVMGLWIAGVLAQGAWMAWRQAQFGRDAEAGLAGPAAVGVLRPRVITPSDFGRRYSPREQFVVLAHEETHIVRHDTRINALVAAARCVNWFNPMLHLLHRFLRIDQELACDAQVIAEHPKVRRSYAEAMLKTQLATRPLPLGCYWLPARAHPLAERIRLLSRTAPSARDQALGLTLLTALTLAVMGSAWAVKPVRVHVVELPTVALHRAPVSIAAAPAEVPSPIASPAAATAPAAIPALPSTPDAVLTEAQADAQAAPMPPDVVEPTVRLPRQRRIYAVAERSSVEPGSAVRLVATALDPEGRPLAADFTAFGSQREYRMGAFVNSGSRQGLFTSVVQRGERLWVTASLNRRFRGDAVGTIEMRSGEIRDLVLPNGQVVTLAPTLRAETPEEVIGASVERGRGLTDAWSRYRQRCGDGDC